MSNYCQPSPVFFFSKPELLRQAKLVHKTERDTDTQRVSHSVLELLGGCWFCSFLLSFFGFDEIVQPLSSSCQSDKEEQAGQEEVGREGKGREGRGGK